MSPDQTELCVVDADRDSITDKEKAFSCVIVACYIPLLVYTVLNLVRFYDKERQKIFNFIPTVNILLFTCIYSNHF